MRYDLHVHSHFSKCSNLQPADILKIARKRSLNGIALTDHNTIRGALLAKKLNKDRNFEIVIGEEIDSDYGHVLVYYLNEQIRSRELEEIICQAHSQDAIICLAHPCDTFRHPFPQEIVREYSKKIHCLETFNSRTILPFFNSSALKLAKTLKLACVAGSDAHFSYEIGRATTIFENYLRNAIKNRKTRTEGSTFFGSFGICHTFIHKRFLR